MRFWFVRHGESSHNAAGLFCGSLDSDLTTKGYEQARVAASSLANKEIDWIVSSPLSRASITARIIAAQHGLRVEHDRRLTEHCKGELEGSPHYKIPSDQWGSVPGAEKMVEMYARVHDALGALLSHPGTGVVVSHAGVARAIAAVNSRIDPAQLYSLAKIDNAEPVLVEIPDGMFLERAPLHLRPQG